jgi:sialate O-acetylesterase
VVPQYFDALVAYAQTPPGQAEVAANYADYEAKQKELRAQGKPPMWPPHHAGAPKRDGLTSVWFNSRVNPLVPFAMRGVIWYQGEAQTWKLGDLRGEYPRDYQHMFPLLIKDWRSRWGQGDFPFLFVQLPNWAKPRPEPSFDGWSIIREAQLKALSVPNTGMAVTIDVGDPDSIHPINKQPVGARLALAARAIAYGEKIVYSGPIYRAMKVEGNTIRLSFDHIGTGLEARGGELKQFVIAGEDMKFVWASARIDGDTVVVQSDMVLKPVAVRYATATNPEGCNLYNKEGLPASPFRTYDDPALEKGGYYKKKMKEPLSLRQAKP